MTSKPPAAPHLGPEAEAARAARLAREATALRENLRRRKAQARAQHAATQPESPAPTFAPTPGAKQSLES